MAGAELEIRFTGDDPEQRAAFDRPHETLGTGGVAAPSLPIPSTASTALPLPLRAESSQVSPTTRPASVDELRELLEAAAAGRATDPQTPTREPATVDELRAAIEAAQTPDIALSTPDRLISSVEMLVAKIDELIDSENRGGKSSTSQPAPDNDKKEPTGVVDRLLSKFDATVNKTLGAMGIGDTRAGRAVSSISKSIVSRGTKAAKQVKAVGSRLANTKAGKAVTAVGRAAATRLGLTAATTATTGASGAGTAAAVAAALGPVGVAAGVTAAAFGAAAYTVKSLSDAVHGLANEIEGFSPDVAYARARHDADRTLATLDRANRIGPEVAQLEAARFRVEESMYEVQTKIYELLLQGAPYFEAILDGVNKGVKTVDDNLPLAIAVAQAAVQASTGNLTGGVATILKAIYDNSVKEDKIPEDIEDPWSRMFGDIDAPDFPAPAAPPVPRFVP